MRRLAITSHHPLPRDLRFRLSAAHRWVCLSSVLWCMAAPVLATNAASADDPAAQQPAVTPNEQDALRGPGVRSSTAPASLVTRDFEGHLVRLETRPEQAALDLLHLSAANRAPADKVLAERFARVTELMIDNYALFLKLQAARQSEDRKVLPLLMREFRQIAAPLFSPTLTDQVAAVIPPESVHEFRRLVMEYFQALASEEPPPGLAPPNQSPSEKPMEVHSGEGMDQAAKPASNRPIPPRVEANLIVREFGHALKAVVTERRERSEDLIKIVQPTPEQEADLRRVMRQYGEQGGLKPTPEQRGEMFRAIMQVLTPEQRKLLIASRSK